MNQRKPHRMKELVIYRGIRKDEILNKFEKVMTAWEGCNKNCEDPDKREEMIELLYDGIHGLIEEGQKRYGFGRKKLMEIANENDAVRRFGYRSVRIDTAILDKALKKY